MNKDGLGRVERAHVDIKDKTGCTEEDGAYVNVYRYLEDFTDEIG